MENLLIIGICFLLGIFLRSRKLVAENGADTLNAVIIWMALPATILRYVHGLTLTPELVYPLVMGVIVFVLSLPAARLMARLMHLDRKTEACLILTMGLGNTSFLGLPMIKAYYGAEALGIGVLCDQGSFLSLAIPGMIIAARASGEQVALRELIKRILLFPPFMALCAGLALIPVPYAEWFESLLGALASTLSPLALLSVGMNLRFGALKGRVPTLFLGLGVKLVLIPAAVAGLYFGLLGLEGQIIRVSVFEAAMPPMVVGGVVAMLHGLDSDLAALMVGMGIPASFITLAGWYWILG